MHKCMGNALSFDGHHSWKGTRSPQHTRWTTGYTALQDGDGYAGGNKRRIRFVSREKNLVSLYWTGCPVTTVLRRDPTTARHGYFWLLGRPPGPVRTSLDNLATPDSSGGPILMPGLARTPDRHRSPQSRAPALKRSTSPRLRVAGLQEHATTPSEWKLDVAVGSFGKEHLQNQNAADCNLCATPRVYLLCIFNVRTKHAKTREIIQIMFS